MDSVIQKFDLGGKTAIVTGAGFGLGRTFAETLGQAGATVIVTDRIGADAEETVGLIEAVGGKAAAMTVNVADVDAIEAMAAEIAKDHGGAIASADGARARLEAELELARCEAVLGEAKVAAKAAAAHQKASAPADSAEEAATEAQVKAEAKRDEADQARADGDEQITAAKIEAAAMIAAAEARYDNAMTALEADMKVALGA